MPAVSTNAVPQRTNAQWLSDLRATGPEQEAALADLRLIILNGLSYALQNWLLPDDPRFSALTEEVAQETLLRVLAHLDSFEGRSQFTTWTHKIAVRVALTELRRRKWLEVSLESLLESETDAAPPTSVGAKPRVRPSPAPSPERVVEKVELLEYVRQIINEELTERQRLAMTAVALKGMPLEEVARRMGAERNALYKLLHDARLRLKRRLAREGLLVSEMLAVFEQE
jgi:RNA polymerase sigma-70 factor (ECF subfamily)